MSELHCRACGRPGLSCGCPSPVAFRAHLVGTVAPASGGLLDGVRLEVDAVRNANIYNGDRIEALERRIVVLEQQVLGLLRRTRRPGEKLPGRKRT